MRGLDLFSGALCAALGGFALMVALLHIECVEDGVMSVLCSDWVEEHFG